MATNEDRQAIDAKIRELENRLNRLEIKKARFGYSADPSLDNEIEDLKFTLDTMRRQIEGPQLLPEARAALDRFAADNMAFVLATLRTLMERQTKTEAQVQHIAQEQYAAGVWRLKAGDDIETLIVAQKHDDTAAVKGRRRNWRIQLINTLLWLLLAMAVIWLAVEVNAR